MQQFEKTVLGRSSRSQSAKGAMVPVEEDEGEEDKGSGSEDEDEAGAVPRRRPVGLMPSFVASIVIHNMCLDQCKKEYHGFFTRPI